jgi:membrane protein DedA with SNARE-associated domain
MTIDISYILTAIVALLIGTFVGYRWGRHAGESHFFRAGLAVKNPEMWDLLHLLVVDSKRGK